MRKLLLSVMLVVLAPCAYSQNILRISGQEGDERFIPLLTAIYKDMGREVEFVMLPSARALYMANSGEFDAEVGRIPSIGPQYPNIIFTREPLLSVHLVAVARKGSAISIRTPNDLLPHKVGYLNGMSVAQHYVSSQAIDAVAVATHAQLADMLTLGRLDVVLMGTAFRDSPVFKVGEAVGEIQQFPVFHLYNVRNKALIEPFDQALRRAKADGRYEALLPD
ncbi:substrate-binding periplasmic protein [Ectopseudomonas guguanensis]|jgi:ABC-type amino acid transport substrate-binding protein|uniref:substrate-binding periplasmic protein n=1 Tax=Ectopseudomonas guguanensis TaxID=1198456 RepID=UPI0028B1D3DE|nr:transporter substrate-binding domain-containing protein [Pseudomonas guguanensis]